MLWHDITAGICQLQVGMTFENNPQTAIPCSRSPPSLQSQAGRVDILTCDLAHDVQDLDLTVRSRNTTQLLQAHCRLSCGQLRLAHTKGHLMIAKITETKHLLQVRLLWAAASLLRHAQTALAAERALRHAWSAVVSSS